MTMTYDIMKFLSKQHYGANVHQIMKELEKPGYNKDNEGYFVTLNCLGVTLSKLKSDGLLKGDRRGCDCCGSPKTYYSLTADGRIALNRK